MTLSILPSNICVYGSIKERSYDWHRKREKLTRIGMQLELARTWASQPSRKVKCFSVLTGISQIPTALTRKINDENSDRK